MQELIEDYKNMSLREVAKKHGISAVTARKKLRKLGIDTSYKNAVRPKELNDKEFIQNELSYGKSCEDIAKKLKVDKRTVAAAINRKSNDEIYYCDWKIHFNSHESCSSWLLRYGFVHPTYSDEMLDKFLNNTMKVEPTLNANFGCQSASRFIRSFNNHFYYSSHKDYNCAADAWSHGNRIVLKKAVEMMWEHNKRCDIFSLMSVIARHFRDFTTVSIFKPWLASYIYDKYLPNGGVVVDPTMGWGGRLIGCIGRNIKYYGFDLNINSVNSNLKILNFINKNYKLDAEITQSDSSVVDFPDGDLLLTSPPYDNTELYHGINSNSTITEPIYHNIFKKFNGIIVLNIPKRHEKLCVDIAHVYGRKQIDLLKMGTTSFMGREKTYEPILVFGAKSL